MNSRIAVIGGAALLLAAAGIVWWYTGVGAALRGVQTAADVDAPFLPVPPVPPRISSGPDYEHCLQMLDADPVGAAAFADAWQATGGDDGALHCRALAQIALGEPAKAAKALERLGMSSSAPPLARAAILDQAVQAWLMAGDAPRAYAAGTQALALSPDDADLLIDRSVAAGTMERYMDAIDDLSRAIQQDPKRIDALVLRAAAWRREGRIEQAKDDVTRALSINPDFPEGLLERGIVRQRMGDQAGARADWQRAIALDPDSATADLAEQNLALLDAGPEKE